VLKLLLGGSREELAGPEELHALYVT